MTQHTITYDDAEWRLVPVRPTYSMIQVAQRMQAAGYRDTGLYDAILAAAPQPGTASLTVPSDEEIEACGSDGPMSLRVALDFADHPRPHPSLQAPADTCGELYKALRRLASEYRALLSRYGQPAKPSNSGELESAATAEPDEGPMISAKAVHAIVAGALYDFMGWLTSRRDQRLCLSSTDEAGPAVEAIKTFAVMRRLCLDDAAVLAWRESLDAAPIAAQPVVTEEMVSRFLGWKLPKDFAPDGGIRFTPPPIPPCTWPSGTNLFHAGQARAMLEYVLGDPVAARPQHPVGAGDGPHPDAAGCCGATVTKRCDGCPHDVQPVVNQSTEREAFEAWRKTQTLFGYFDVWKARAALAQQPSVQSVAAVTFVHELAMGAYKPDEIEARAKAIARMTPLEIQPSAQDREDAERWRYWSSWWRNSEDDEGQLPQDVIKALDEVDTLDDAMDAAIDAARAAKEE